MRNSRKKRGRDDFSANEAALFGLAPEELFGADLWRETRRIVDKAHELLDGPRGNGQLDGGYETERVCLDLPKGLLLVAAYAALKQERGHNAGEWRFIERRLEGGDKILRRLLRRYVTQIMWNALQYELHQLAIGDHPVFAKDAKCRLSEKEPGERPDAGVTDDKKAEISDDDVPF